ncbi:MAG: hypothetical protein LBQ12_02905 [Deltaproteobacteria bacterium]|jgi:hypothetical protein|nr:hypothetical protein [Deltaproteobacteria bacterium]
MVFKNRKILLDRICWPAIVDPNVQKAQLYYDEETPNIFTCSLGGPQKLGIINGDSSSLTLIEVDGKRLLSPIKIYTADKLPNQNHDIQNFAISPTGVIFIITGNHNLNNEFQYSYYKTTVNHIFDIVASGETLSISDDKDAILLTSGINHNAHACAVEILVDENGVEMVNFIRGVGSVLNPTGLAHDEIHAQKVSLNIYDPVITDCGTLNGTGDSSLGYAISSGKINIPGQSNGKTIHFSDRPIR